MRCILVAVVVHLKGPWVDQYINQKRLQQQAVERVPRAGRGCCDAAHPDGTLGGVNLRWGVDAVTVSTGGYMQWGRGDSRGAISLRRGNTSSRGRAGADCAAADIATTATATAAATAATAAAAPSQV